MEVEEEIQWISKANVNKQDINMNIDKYTDCLILAEIFISSSIIWKVGKLLKAV